MLQPLIVQLALFAFLYCLSWPAPARTIMAPDPAHAAKRADFVYDAIVTEIAELRNNSELCGFAYTATVLKAQKGHLAAKSTLRFGYRGGLQVGVQYRLFLVEDQTGEMMISLIEEAGSLQEELRKFAAICQQQYKIGTMFFWAVPLDDAK